MILKVRLFILIMLLYSFSHSDEETHALKIEVPDLRNTKGVVQFTLYNTKDAFPDQEYKKYYRKLVAEITDGFSTVTFKNLPPGKYAVNILHDEDENGKIKKGLVLPKEGIGFSNYQSIGLLNRPEFSKAGIVLKSDTTIQINVIYM
jgi:uncharacterized protein (DUF2141 family)